MRTLLLFTGALLAGACAAEPLPEAEPVASGSSALNECGTPDEAVANYFCYLATHTCQTSTQLGCLEPTSYVATRSDGRRVTVGGVYRWRAEGDAWADYPGGPVRKRVLVHFMTEYMKKLRNAYEVEPSFHGHVYDMVDFIVTDGVRRSGALVWENAHGVAHAMEQGDMMKIFAAMAVRHHMHGHTKEARGTMRYALEAARPFFLPVGVRNGGVRSVDETWCAAKTARLRPCFWFHSRGRGVHQFTGSPVKQTILNQHLHGVRDTLELAWTLRAVDPAILPTDVALPPGHRAWSDWSDALEDRAIGGLYVLAYGSGPKAVAPDRPPNLAQFMIRRTSPDYYTAAYGFDLEGGGAYEIAHANTCHYQTHSMSLLANLRLLIDDYLAEELTSTGQAWRLDEAMARLLTGAGEATGVAGSTKAMLQWFWGSFPGYFLGDWECPQSSQMKRGTCATLAPHFGLAPSWCAIFPE